MLIRLISSLCICLVCVPLYAQAKNSKKVPPQKSKATAEQLKRVEKTVKDYVEEHTGDPDTIKWIAVNPIGARHWLGKNLEDIENLPKEPTPYLAVQVKYRAKNNSGAMQAYSYAVLVRDWTAVAACPYPHVDLVAPNDRFTSDFLEMFGN